MTPPLLPDAERRILVKERLRLLSIGYYISGGMGVLMASMLIFHFVFLLVFSFMPESAWGQKMPHHTTTPPAETLEPTPLESPSAPVPATPDYSGPPVAIFRVLAGLFGIVMVMGWILGGLTAYAGKCVRDRKRKLFVYIVAGYNCLFIPYGTLLGVSTFMVLTSPEGQEEFPSGS